jgi:hypothetical protein
MTHVKVQRRRLSTLQTLFVKAVMPLLWIMVFVQIVFGPFFDDLTLPLRHVKWLFVALLLISGAQIGWYSARLKRVFMDDSCVFVRGFAGEAVVPLSAVGQVRQRRFFDRLVTLTFNRDTDAGIATVFLPRRTRWAFWREDEVVEELGLWPLAFGTWPLALGLWPLAFGPTAIPCP